MEYVQYKFSTAAEFRIIEEKTDVFAWLSLLDRLHDITQRVLRAYGNGQRVEPDEPGNFPQRAGELRPERPKNYAARFTSTNDLIQVNDMLVKTYREFQKSASSLKNDVSVEFRAFLQSKILIISEYVNEVMKHWCYSSMDEERVINFASLVDFELKLLCTYLGHTSLYQCSEGIKVYVMSHDKSLVYFRGRLKALPCMNVSILHQYLQSCPTHVRHMILQIRESAEEWMEHLDVVFGETGNSLIRYLRHVFLCVGTFLGSVVKRLNQELRSSETYLYYDNVFLKVQLTSACMLAMFMNIPLLAQRVQQVVKDGVTIPTLPQLTKGMYSLCKHLLTLLSTPFPQRQDITLSRQSSTSDELQSTQTAVEVVQEDKDEKVAGDGSSQDDNPAIEVGHPPEDEVDTSQGYMAFALVGTPQEAKTAANIGTPQEAMAAADSCTHQKAKVAAEVDAFQGCMADAVVFSPQEAKAAEDSGKPQDAKAAEDFGTLQKAKAAMEVDTSQEYMLFAVVGMPQKNVAEDSGTLQEAKETAEAGTPQEAKTAASIDMSQQSYAAVNYCRPHVAKAAVGIGTPQGAKKVADVHTQQAANKAANVGMLIEAMVSAEIGQPIARPPYDQAAGTGMLNESKTEESNAASNVDYSQQSSVSCSEHSYSSQDSESSTSSSDSSQQGGSSPVYTDFIFLKEAKGLDKRLERVWQAVVLFVSEFDKVLAHPQ